MMKHPQKITKIRLSSPIDESFTLFGIVSHEPDYKLSLTLNQRLGIALKNIDPVTILDSNNNIVSSFSRFKTSGTLSDDTIYALTSNRYGSLFMLKKLKNIDYLFHIHHSEECDLNLKVASILRETENINAVFSIDPQDLNDKNISYLIS